MPPILNTKIKNICCAGALAMIIFLSMAPLFSASAIELNYPPIGGQTITNATTPSEYINYVFLFGIGAVGLVSLAAFIWGAIKYTTSEAIGNKQAAKERMTEALIGLALVLISVVVLSYINQGLVNFSDPVVLPVPAP